jgi:molybdopterin/thiamine biosynthesis adenylyltransferase
MATRYLSALEGFYFQMAGRRVLVVGAGGIGCEVLNRLRRMSVENITIVDNDTVELSNLHRQVFFARSDIGRPKAVCAGEKIKMLSRGISVSAHNKSIFEFPLSFFREHSCILSCVDNEEARNYLNLMRKFSQVPLIESGSAGYLGQVSVHIPGVNECYRCNQVGVEEELIPVCTLRARPRTWRDCVNWVLKHFVEGVEEALEEKDPGKQGNRIRRLVEEACGEGRVPLGERESLAELIIKEAEGLGKKVEVVHKIGTIRGEEFGVEVGSVEATRRIADRTIPAIATTNSVLSGIVAIELERVLGREEQSSHFPPLRYLSMGASLICTVKGSAPSKSCPVCAAEPVVVSVGTETRLSSVIEKIKESSEKRGSGEEEMALFGEDGLLYDSDFRDNYTERLVDLHQRMPVLRAFRKQKEYLVYLEAEQDRDETNG